MFGNDAVWSSFVYLLWSEAVTTVLLKLLIVAVIFEEFKIRTSLQDTKFYVKTRVVKCLSCPIILRRRFVTSIVAIYICFLRRSIKLWQSKSSPQNTINISSVKYGR